MAGLAPDSGSLLGTSSGAPGPGKVKQAGSTPKSSLGQATKAQTSMPSSSSTPIPRTPSSAPPNNTPTISKAQTPSLTPTPTPSARPLTTFIISTTTRHSSSPTPSLSNTQPLPSPTSAPTPFPPPAIPSSAPGTEPSQVPGFVPPPDSTPVPVLTPSFTPTFTPTPTPTPTPPPPGGIAAPSQAESTKNGGAKLMPALPITLGSVGGVLIFGMIIGLLYRKSKWPFYKRSKFAEIDELEVERHQELERQQKQKWDPRITRSYRTQDAGVNF